MRHIRFVIAATLLTSLFVAAPAHADAAWTEANGNRKLCGRMQMELHDQINRRLGTLWNTSTDNSPNGTHNPGVIVDARNAMQLRIARIESDIRQITSQKTVSSKACWTLMMYEATQIQEYLTYVIDNGQLPARSIAPDDVESHTIGWRGCGSKCPQ
jgi:hypothetical protein